MRRVKRWHVLLLMCGMLSTSAALAEDFKTIRGKEYRNATVSRIEPDGIVIRTKNGISKIYFGELPKDVADKWLRPVIAAQQAADAAQTAAEQKRIEAENAAERERTEKHNKADADLKIALDEFQAAEHRGSVAYENAQKGTVAGQVFVSTERGENYKLGAVQVGLFARDAIDVLLVELKRYADFKIEELSPAVDAAKRAMEQSDTSAHLEDLEKAVKDRRHYYSGSFYLGYLQNPIQTAETDADGRFLMNVPKQGSFVLAAKAQRYAGRTFIGQSPIDRTEHYAWLQPVSLNGQQQLTQNLSNNNLTGATESSALIRTQD